ncbi:MAG: hypothetical protein K8F52_18625 [Candidatus Scalindua rubra]|nr:hypothetical protein [Candidatus Scalindua rubra]
MKRQAGSTKLLSKGSRKYYEKKEAFIRHEKFDETKDALEGQGYTGMSVCTPHQTLIYSNYIYRSI